MNILLVEDNAAESQLLQEALAKDTLGPYQLTLAVSLTEGLKHLAANGVDVTLLDMNLPDSRGIETLRTARRQAPHVPIIVLTASDDEALAKQALQEGAQDYLAKGYLQVYQSLLGRSIRYAIERNRLIVARQTGADPVQTAELDKAHQQLKQTQVMLIQAEKMAAVGQLASGIAHEVKNPLSVILQGITFLEMELPPENAQAAEVVQMIKDAVKRSDTIIRGLLDFSRPTKLELIPGELTKVIEASLILVRKQLTVKNIQVELEFAPDLPQVLLDENAIKQVFINLIVNAFQAMPKGGQLAIRVRSKRLAEVGNGVGNRASDLFRLGDPVLACEVQDTGGGMPKAVLEKVFDPFFTTKPTGQGTGLGLAITRTIIESHRGMIYMESEEGKGTTVHIVVPIAQAPKPSAAPVGPGPCQEAPHA